MKLEGTAEFPYKPAEVWRALHDVDILVKAVPGCQSMAATGSNEYSVAVALGVAAIKGEYEGKLKGDDVDFPRYYVLYGEGGTWSAGRRIARARREGGSPPLSVISDGTVF